MSTQLKTIVLALIACTTALLSCGDEEIQVKNDSIVLWTALKGEVTSGDPVNEIYLCSENFEEMRVITPVKRGGLYDFETSPVVSRDGNKIAYYSWRNEKQEVFIQDLETEEEKLVVVPSTFTLPRDMIWAVDNNMTLMFIASSAIDLSLQVLSFNLETKTTIVLTDEFTKPVAINSTSFGRVVPCSLNGDFLALGSSFNVKMSATGEVLDTLRQDNLYQISFNKDFTVAVSYDAGLNSIINLNWPSLMSTDLGLIGQNPKLSPDGNRVIYFEKTLDMYDMYVANASDGQNIVSYTENIDESFKKAIPSISWAADSRSFFFANGIIYRFPENKAEAAETFYEKDAKAVLYRHQ